MTPLVTIILPCYNRATLLPRALESIIAQTYKNWELLIIDDGSTDNSVAVIKPYIEKYPAIRYYSLDKNAGACVARNRGITQAKGEYIAFLDSDDEYLPAKLEEQVKCFQTSTIRNLGVVSCGRQDVRASKVYFQWIPKIKGNVFKKLIQKDRIGANTSLLMVKTEVIQNYKVAFDPQMPACQDWDFLIQLCRHVNFDFVPDVLVTIHHHAGERVYTQERALVAFENQYEKIKSELLADPCLHKRFLLKMAIQNYLYGRPQQAIKILKHCVLKNCPKTALWHTVIKGFPLFGNMPSRIIYKVVRKLS
jgi:glycosyltransferase involved in cell wall biosynthesis